MKNITNSILRFLLVIVLQILVLNKLQFGTICNPYIYIYFLFCLPITMPRWADVSLAFLLGITIDILSDTLGVHAFATTLIGYLRYWFIQWMVPDLDRITNAPGFDSFGTLPYLKYVCSLTLIHHAVLFFGEVLSIQHFGWLILRIVASTLLTLVLILGYERFRRRKE